MTSRTSSTARRESIDAGTQAGSASGSPDTETRSSISRRTSAAPTSTEVQGTPSAFAASAATPPSSYECSANRIVKALSERWGWTLRETAVTSDESSPPERKTPQGTETSLCRATAVVKIRSNDSSETSTEGSAAKRRLQNL